MVHVLPGGENYRYSMKDLQVLQDDLQVLYENLQVLWDLEYLHWTNQIAVFVTAMI